MALTCADIEQPSVEANDVLCRTHVGHCPGISTSDHSECIVFVSRHRVNRLKLWLVLHTHTHKEKHTSTHGYALTMSACTVLISQMSCKLFHCLPELLQSVYV